MSMEFRGLELHGRRMWERARIVEALDFIAQHGMTALVLHETDLVHNLVYPRRWFDPYAQWKNAPARRGENAIQNNRVYFEHILHLARNRGVEVWAEVKELGFPDEVLEARPSLIIDGRICPSDPFWLEFTEQKTTELVDEFPLLSGMIVSAGSPEGRASLVQRKCTCARCASVSVETWYRDLILAIHRPLAARGKRLAMREFAYKPADHEVLLRAIDTLPADIVVCIKNTPHDFYPTFPDNPALGRLQRTQWLEYETYGQFYGMGVVPCFLYDDVNRRFAHARQQGVSGALLRVEWERINDWWALETLNELNLIAGAALARGEALPAEDVCARWLASHGHATASAPWLAEVMLETWPIVRGALYIDGFLFADSSFLPRSIQRAWWTMEQKHCIADWDPSRRGALELDRARVATLLAEKEQARRRVIALAARVRAGHPSLSAALRDALVRQMDVFVTYVEGFEHCARVCLMHRWMERRPQDIGPAEREAMQLALEGLERYGARVRREAEAATLPHVVQLLMDYHRVDDIVAEGRAALAAATTAPRSEAGNSQSPR
jgi:hypothetical protein